jgi:hypothetical protein
MAASRGSPSEKVWDPVNREVIFCAAGVLSATPLASEVERAFADLKDVLDMRPIYHKTDNRGQAHIGLIHRAIEKKLKVARLDLSATEALTALKSVRVVDIDLGDSTTKRSVTAGTHRAASST